MISFDPNKKRFTQLKEVSDTQQVNQLLDDGFVLLEAGLVKGKRVFLLGKEKITLTRPPNVREQEELIDEAIHAIEPNKTKTFNAMPEWLSGLLGIGVGLWLIMVASTNNEPFLGWSILVRLVGTALALIGLVQLIMNAVQNKRFWFQTTSHT